MAEVVMAVVDRWHVVVEHGSEVEWVRFRRCWGATREPMMGCDEPVLGCDEPMLGCAISSGYFSLSSIFLGCNSFEGKIKPEMVLHQRGLILWSTQKINFSWPNFQYVPNIERGVKGFPEIVFRRNKRSQSLLRNWKSWHSSPIEFIFHFSLGESKKTFNQMKAIPHPFFLQFKITNALCVIEFKNLKMSRKTQA